MLADRKRSISGDDVVAAIDVGASKTVCAIATLNDHGDETPAPEILGIGLCGAQQRHAARRTVHDIEDALRSAVDTAERMADRRIRDAYFAIGGRYLHARRLGVDLDMGWGQVTADDIAECHALAERECAPSGFSPLHARAVSFTVDDEDAGHDPLGVAGVRLGATYLGVSVREGRTATIDAVAERCGLNVRGYVAAPLAAAESVLLEDEKELGAIVLDIGAGATSYSVFERGAAIDCGGVAVGGDHITRDIAQLFGAPVKSAERVKTLYGAAMSGPADEHRLLELEQLGEPGDSVRIARAELASVIAPRLDEILEMALAEVNRNSGRRFGPRRLILTGGGSLLVGAREAAEKVFGLKARLGRPVAMEGAPDAATSPQYSVCAGILQLAAAQQRSSAAAAPAARSMRVAAGGVLSGVGQWLRDNF